MRKLVRNARAAWGAWNSLPTVARSFILAVTAGLINAAFAWYGGLSAYLIVFTSLCIAAMVVGGSVLIWEAIRAASGWRRYRWLEVAPRPFPPGGLFVGNSFIDITQGNGWAAIDVKALRGVRSLRGAIVAASVMAGEDVWVPLAGWESARALLWDGSKEPKVDLAKQESQRLRLARRSVAAGEVVGTFRGKRWRERMVAGRLYHLTIRLYDAEDLIRDVDVWVSLDPSRTALMPVSINIMLKKPVFHRADHTA